MSTLPRGPIRTAILISGSGSNMESLIKATQAQKKHPARIDLVISNRPNAAGIEKAKTLGVEVKTIDHKSFASRKGFEAAMDRALASADIELICCAGFMRVLTAWFTSRWTGRMINIHPSLLPKYKGLNTHKRALEAGDKEHGATIHWVSEELDGGHIIAQSKVAVSLKDTEKSLKNKVLSIEHALYCETLALISERLLNSHKA